MISLAQKNRSYTLQSDNLHAAREEKVEIYELKREFARQIWHVYKKTHKIRTANKIKVNNGA